jgi:glyoxylase-like metal-dependent hydrolase (beta-lactamase superfamily II)
MPVAVKSFFHPATSTFSHLVVDTLTCCAALVDPVLDFDIASGRTGTTVADAIIGYCNGKKDNDKKLTLVWILETHAHADHLSAAPYIKEQLGGKIGIGEGIKKVQQHFSKLYNLDDTFSTEGEQFDYLFKDNEEFNIGELTAKVLNTPGHTNDSVTYLVDDAAFVGDTVFMPDYGTARCDFPGGDARQLYYSIQNILALPEDTRLFLCHDYIPDNSQRKPSAFATVKQQRLNNIHIHMGISENDYIEMRKKRDKNLPEPKLIIPSIQVNVRAGQMPAPEKNGTSYLKVPINILGNTSR